MALSAPDNFVRSIFGAFALVGIAVTIGAVHSLVSPVTLRVDLSRTSVTGAAGETGSGAADAERAVGEGGPPTGGQSPPTVESGAAGDVFISLDEAVALWNEHEAVFIDSRNEDEYAASHIPGAIFLSAESIDSGVSGEELDVLLKNFGTDWPLVLYCHGGTCDASENTAIRLQKMGFTNMRIMRAGFDDWAAGGNPVESGGGG